MKWLEISTQVSALEAELAAEVLQGIAYGGVAIEEPESSWPDDEGCPTVAPGPLTVKAYLPLEEAPSLQLHLLRQALAPLGPVIFRELKEEDWAESWKAYFVPQRLGQHLVVKPPWRDYSPLPQDLVLEIDPQMAFGTGLHPTTAMCLAELEKRVRPGMAVLDLGTGSGILAIAAARLGASTVLARDIDPVAVAAAKENVWRNGMENTVSVELGSLPEEKAFDLIVANISARVLLDLAPGLRAALRPRGVLLLGGILEGGAEKLAARLGSLGMDRESVSAEGDWRTLVLTASALP